MNRPHEGPHRDRHARLRAGTVHSGDALKRKLKFSGRFALTSVAFAALCLTSPLASALGLGRLTVKSALGESMQAEIEVTDMTAERGRPEHRVAPPESYRAANVDYNPVLPSPRETLRKRPDGRLFVRLISDRGVQEPFVDVILEISWATGRLVREYTLAVRSAGCRARRSAVGARPSATVAGRLRSAAAAPMPLPSARRAPCRPAKRARPRAQPRVAARVAERRAATRQRRAPRPRRRVRPAPGRRASPAAPSADEYRVRVGRHALEDRRAHAAPRRVARPDAGRAVPRQSAAPSSATT